MAAKVYALSTLERTLLAIYNTVPVAVRAQIGASLFDAWTNPTDKRGDEARRKDAWPRFELDELGVDVFNDLCAGESRRAAHSRQRRRS